MMRPGLVRWPSSPGHAGGARSRADRPFGSGGSATPARAQVRRGGWGQEASSCRLSGLGAVGSVEPGIDPLLLLLLVADQLQEQERSRDQEGEVVRDPHERAREW